jgi:hypothetical protein
MVGDKLTTRDFGTLTRGFAAAEDAKVAVCVLPGTELAFSSTVKVANFRYFVRQQVETLSHATAIFRQVNKNEPRKHHDALEFPDGRIVLLTQLCEGQEATVLQLPAQPASAGEANAQRRIAYADWKFGTDNLCVGCLRKPKEVPMFQTASRLLPEVLLILVTAVATHLVMSFAQTLMHYKLGHHPMGGTFFRNHINFHHTYYSKDHLVSRTYLGDEGNNTPFFFVPVFLVGGCAYFILPLNLFVVLVIACAMSFYAHVFFDKEYHVEGSRLQRFAWFRRQQELHFVHHRHANSNFGVIHFFWDKILGTYRRPDAGT